MASKIKVDQIQTADGSGTIALQNQLSGMTDASMPSGSFTKISTAIVPNTIQYTTGSANEFLTATITVDSTSDYIFAIGTICTEMWGQSSSNPTATWSLVDNNNSTVLRQMYSHFSVSGGNNEESITITHLFNPASTGTYTVRLKMAHGQGRIAVRGNSQFTNATQLQLIYIKG